jgi:hypothetical protein
MNMHHLFTARIGHLAMNTELFLRRQSRGMVEGELFRITDHFSGEKVANEQLYKMIKRRAVVHEVTLQEYQALVAQGNKTVECCTADQMNFGNLTISNPNCRSQMKSWKRGNNYSIRWESIKAPMCVSMTEAVTIWNLNFREITSHTIITEIAISR